MVINTSGESDRVEEALRQTLNYRAAATIVLSGTPPATLITTCVNSGQRVILINRDDHVAGPVHISVDNAAAAREALHMLRRCGCRRIAVVSSTAGTPSLVARERAFVAAAGAAGLCNERRSCRSYRLCVRCRSRPPPAQRLDAA